MGVPRQIPFSIVPPQLNSTLSPPPQLNWTLPLLVIPCFTPPNIITNSFTLLAFTYIFASSLPHLPNIFVHIPNICPPLNIAICPLLPSPYIFSIY